MTEARNSTRQPKEALQESRMEVDDLCATFALARAAEVNAVSAAANERRTAHEKSVELQGIIGQAEKSHTVLRETMEARLKSSRLAQSHESRCQQVKYHATALPHMTEVYTKDSSSNGRVLYQFHVLYTHRQNYLIVVQM